MPQVVRIQYHQTHTDDMPQVVLVRYNLRHTDDMPQVVLVRYLSSPTANMPQVVLVPCHLRHTADAAVVVVVVVVVVAPAAAAAAVAAAAVADGKDHAEDEKDNARSGPSRIEFCGGSSFAEVLRRVVVSPAAAPRQEALCGDARIAPNGPWSPKTSSGEEGEEEANEDEDEEEEDRWSSRSSPFHRRSSAL